MTQYTDKMTTAKCRLYYASANCSLKCWRYANGQIEETTGGNVGDLLSRFIVEKITQKSILHANSGAPNKLIALGSLLALKTLYSGSVFWGTGLLRQRDVQERFHTFDIKLRFRKLLRGASRITALRGPISGAAVLGLGFKDPGIYGDPAILLPRLYMPRVTSTHSRIGLILHHTHAESLGVESILRIVEAGVKYIHIVREYGEDTLNFIDDICSCDRIFSTSLHGVIIAQAYGVPAAWLVIDGKPIRHDDAELKFHDYFLGTEQTDQSPVVIEEPTSVRPLFNVTIPEVRRFPSADALIDAFPYEMFN